MRLVDETERIVLLIMPGVPALFILVNGVLRALGARSGNGIVDAFASGAEQVTPGAVTDMFVDQAAYQTGLLALAAYGAVALVVVLLFRWIRAAVKEIQGSRRLGAPEQELRERGSTLSTRRDSS